MNKKVNRNPWRGFPIVMKENHKFGDVIVRWLNEKAEYQYTMPINIDVNVLNHMKENAFMKWAYMSDIEHSIALNN